MLLFAGAVAVGAAGPPEQAGDNAPDDQPASGPAAAEEAGDADDRPDAGPTAAESADNAGDERAEAAGAAAQRPKSVGPPG